MRIKCCTRAHDAKQSFNISASSRKKMITLTSILLAATLSSCLESGTDDNADGETGTTNNAGTGGTTNVVAVPRLLVDRTLTTVNINDQKSIRVRSDDGAGNAIAFTATQSGSCVISQATADQLVITARAAACTDTVTVTAGDKSASMVVNVIDPTAMDIGEGLMIKYTNVHTDRWNDNGSGGDRDVTFWHPTSGGDGWYPLGSYIRGSYTNVNTTLDGAVVIAKDQGGNGTLAAPTGYTRIWNDAGSGADRDGAVWNPTCPANFVAMGSVVSNGSQPSTEDVRCVAERFTAPAKAGGLVYNDLGTGADGNLSIYEIAAPDLPTKSGLGNKSPMPAGTYIACNNYTVASCNLAATNLLLVPLSDYEQGEYMDQAVLTGYRALDLGDTLTATVRIPFTLIPAAKADSANTNRNVTQTPFYTLSRIERFASLAALDNRQGENDVVLTYTSINTFANTDTSEFTKSVGLSVTVGGGAKFLGTGGEWSATLDTNLSWTNTTSSTFGGSVSNTAAYKAPPGKFVELVQVQTVFQAKDATGLPVGTPISAGKNVLKYLQYPL